MSASRTLGLPLAVVLLIGTAACGGTDESPDPAPDPAQPRQDLTPSASPGGVEPQVLQDVISAALPVPGPEMRRALRIQQFLRDKAIQECGGDPGPADATYNREDQSRFPDLDLIRERGLTEQAAVEEEDQRLDGLDADCPDLVPDVALYDAWIQVSDSWYDVVISAEQSSAVQDQKPALARCLSERAEARISAVDPVNQYLQLVNEEVARGADTARQRRLSTVYAECARDYFGALRTALLKSRPDAVDRNREALSGFAAEVVAAGYVP